MRTFRAEIAAAVISAAFPTGAPRMVLHAFCWGYNGFKKPHHWHSGNLRCVCLVPTIRGFQWNGYNGDIADVTIPLTEISSPYHEPYVLHKAMRLGMSLNGNRESFDDEREMYQWLASLDWSKVEESDDDQV